MPYKCKGICDRDQDQRSQSNRDIYAHGNAFCKQCDMKRPRPITGNRCDCCGAKMRLKPSATSMCHMRRIEYNRRKNHKPESTTTTTTTTVKHYKPYGIVKEMKANIIALQISKQYKKNANM